MVKWSILGKKGTLLGGNYHFWVINDHFGEPSVPCGQILQKILARGRAPPLLQCQDFGNIWSPNPSVSVKQQYCAIMWQYYQSAIQCSTVVLEALVSGSTPPPWLIGLTDGFARSPPESSPWIKLLWRRCEPWGHKTLSRLPRILIFLLRLRNS